MVFCVLSKSCASTYYPIVPLELLLLRSPRHAELLRVRAQIAPRHHLELQHDEHPRVDPRLLALSQDVLLVLLGLLQALVLLVDEVQVVPHRDEVPSDVLLHPVIAALVGDDVALSREVLVAVDLLQVELDDHDRVGGDVLGLGALGAVAEVGRDVHLPPVAFHHPLHRLAPPLDDRVRTELRLLPLVAHRPVDQGHLEVVDDRGLHARVVRPASLLEHFVPQSGGEGLDVLLFGLGVEEGLVHVEVVGGGRDSDYQEEEERQGEERGEEEAAAGGSSSSGGETRHRAV
mmetsp:Transcript_36070/g.76914  ORF Transcript_36070/g.76914 Transcript_36070/m.76914 type:complete len:289 (+) Transcript_36070:148-1014(+)